MKLIFYMHINIKLFCKLIPLILVGVVRPVQIAQNNKLASIFIKGHRRITGQQGKGGDHRYFFYFHPRMNIERLICSHSSEMSTSYF